MLCDPLFLLPLIKLICLSELVMVSNVKPFPLKDKSKHMPYLVQPFNISSWLVRLIAFVNVLAYHVQALFREKVHAYRYQCCLWILLLLLKAYEPLIAVYLHIPEAHCEIMLLYVMQHNNRLILVIEEVNYILHIEVKKVVSAYYYDIILYPSFLKKELHVSYCSKPVLL